MGASTRPVPLQGFGGVGNAPRRGCTKWLDGGSKGGVLERDVAARNGVVVRCGPAAEQRGAHGNVRWYGYGSRRMGPRRGPAPLMWALGGRPLFAVDRPRPHAAPCPAKSGLAAPVRGNARAPPWWLGIVLVALPRTPRRGPILRDPSPAGRVGAAARGRGSSERISRGRRPIPGRGGGGGLGRCLGAGRRG